MRTDDSQMRSVSFAESQSVSDAFDQILSGTAASSVIGTLNPEDSTKIKWLLFQFHLLNVEVSLFTKVFTDEVGYLLGTGFQNFETDLFIKGLMKVDGDRLDILAVFSEKRRQGNFRAFIERAKTHFKVIGVWDILGEVLDGWIWTKVTHD